MPRNRSAEATAKGLALKAYMLTPATLARIESAREHLRTDRGPATAVRALEWLVEEGSKKLSKKSSPSS